MKLSVCMITYNHENYIAQAIESVLMQKTNFLYELIIGEDFSLDDTRNICLKYANEFPERIKLLPSVENYGMMANFIRTFNACSGKYIAMLEGDDYWTDPFKLQRQIDFLESNTFSNATCTNIRVINEISNESSVMSNPEKQINFNFIKVCKGIFFPTCTIVFRNQKNIDLGWALNSSIGDLALLMEFTKEGGLISFLDFESAVYRIHSNGVFGSNSKLEQQFKEELLFELALNHYTGKILNKHIQKRLVKIYYAIYLQLRLLDNKGYKNYLNNKMFKILVINPLLLLKIAALQFKMIRTVKRKKIFNKTFG